MEQKFKILSMNNPGVLIGKIPDNLFLKIKDVVNDPDSRKMRSASEYLVATIKEEYYTPNIPEFLDYVENMYKVWNKTFKADRPPHVIGNIWTNYMKKGEFNPNHTHPGAIASFVLWVTIPFDVHEEIKYNGPRNNSGLHQPKNSAFEFTYAQYNGGIRTLPIYTQKDMEGTIMMFPSDLMHCVYPFFTSENERISIAGNINPKLG